MRNSELFGFKKSATAAAVSCVLLGLSGNALAQPVGLGQKPGLNMPSDWRSFLRASLSWIGISNPEFYEDQRQRWQQNLQQQQQQQQLSLLQQDLELLQSQQEPQPELVSPTVINATEHQAFQLHQLKSQPDQTVHQPKLVQAVVQQPELVFPAVIKATEHQAPQVHQVKSQPDQTVWPDADSQSKQTPQPQQQTASDQVLASQQLQKLSSASHKSGEGETAAQQPVAQQPQTSAWNVLPPSANSFVAPKRWTETRDDKNTRKQQQRQQQKQTNGAQQPVAQQMPQPSPLQQQPPQQQQPVVQSPQDKQKAKQMLTAPLLQQLSPTPPASCKRKREVSIDIENLIIDSETRVEFDGKMQGARKLIKRGSGTLVLNHAGEMAQVHLEKGRIELGHAQALGTGDLLMDDGSALDLMADGMVIANDLHMTGSDDPVLNTGAYDGTWAGDITGDGFVTKQGTGTWTLTSTANSYTGATDVAEGMLRAGAANTFSVASAHSIAAGATLNLAGFEQTIAGLHNSGTVQLSGASGIPGAVLTVTGPYVGNGGELAMASSRNASDRLLLSGSTAVASGSTSVRLTNIDDLGAKTTGNGIEIISTESGARLEPGAFTLAGDYVAVGAYEYRLHQTQQSASLQSSYRAEVPLLSALPAQLRQADMAMLGDLHKRLGDEVAGSGAGRRAWGRIVHTDPSIHQQGTVSAQSSGHLTGFQAGLDLYADKNVNAGFYLGELKGDMSVTGFASGVARKSVGYNHLQSRYLGAYGTWQGDAGWYADVVAQVADYRSSLHTSEKVNANTKGSGQLASLEVGKSFAINSHWQVEPQAQLVYRRISLDDTALRLATVKNKAQSDWTLRMGARIKVAC